MNAHVRRTFYLFALGFVALVGVLAYWQVYARESLANNPDNSLQTRRQLEVPRGLILAGDGETVLAKSEKRQTGDGDTTYERVYPQGELYAAITGYWSTKYGATGIEIAENSHLSGTAEPATLDELINQITGGPQPGNNVQLTIRPQLQRLAYEQLAASSTGRGSAVAVDPKTGDVLAMASVPSYDPNNIDERFPELQNDPNDPLVNRATQGLFPPGSTFKVITAAAALKSGISPTDVFFDDGTYETPGYDVVNYGDASYGQVTFAEALAFSINTIFAEVAVERIGAQTLYNVAKSFGYYHDYEEFALPVTPSTLGLPPDQLVGGALAQVSFGQGQNLSNVFEMANATAAIANDGTMMQPRIIEEVRSPDGIIIERPAPREKLRPLDPATADTLTDMMVGVVEEGSATAAQIRGVEVAGKTGTAEVPPRPPHSWFVAFAPADDPQIAVAVLVENGGDGERAALPIARTLIEAHLGVEGRSVPDNQRPAVPQGAPDIQDILPEELQESLPEGIPGDPFSEN